MQWQSTEHLHTPQRPLMHNTGRKKKEESSPPDVVIVNRVLGKLQPLGAHPLQHPGQQVAHPARRRVGALAQLGPAGRRRGTGGGGAEEAEGRVGNGVGGRVVWAKAQAGSGLGVDGAGRKAGRAVCVHGRQMVQVQGTPAASTSLPAWLPAFQRRQPCQGCTARTHWSSASTVCSTKAPRLPLETGGSTTSRCRTAGGRRQREVLSCQGRAGLRKAGRSGGAALQPSLPCTPAPFLPCHPGSTLSLPSPPPPRRPQPAAYSRTRVQQLLAPRVAYRKVLQV